MQSQTPNSLEWAVKICCDGIAPNQFASHYIGKLFQARVGPVSRISEHFEGGKKWIKVVFAREEEQRKALCMSRYSIGGTTIQVSLLPTKTPFSFPKPKNKNHFKASRTPDARRNLYVLNLPHDLSAQAFHDLFAAHGTPTHTVLLKTLDSCSRRRGFVVMSTHDEAQAVINWLDGVCLRGFQLRITWANIDRSNGFLSGYDRSTFSQNENPSMTPLTLSDPVPISKSSALDMDTSTIVASNIPSSLFPAPEIDILFKPFGAIKDIRLVPLTPSLSNAPAADAASYNSLAQTAVVTFEKATDAIAAKNTLHGQVYDGFTLAVGFVSCVGKDKPETPRAIYSTPFMSSTNITIRQDCQSRPFSSLSPNGNALRGLPSVPHDLTSLRCAMNSVPARSGNWMSYTPLLSQNSGFQLSNNNSLAFPGVKNSTPPFPLNRHGHENGCHTNHSPQF